LLAGRVSQRYGVDTVYTQNPASHDLAGYAYQQLRKDIIGGEFAPGTPLFEVHLATRMGMSRTPVREALKVLARDGLVQAVPTRGYIVPYRSADDLRELFELRESLEGTAARYAALRADDAELAQLEALCARYESVQDWQLWAQVGTEFHNLLVAAARNQRLVTILESLNGQIVHSRRSVLRSDAQRRDAAIREHRAILEAVKSRDPARAEAAAREHAQLSYRAALYSYESPGAASG
jgi:DNA-binding GntR family transcriptional regulator